MTENISTREIEESIIAMLILNPEYITDTLEILKPNDFVTEDYKKFYQVLINIYEEEGDAFNDVIVLNELEKNKLLDKIGGKEKLFEIMANSPLGVSVLAYAKMLKERSIKKKLLTACKNIEMEIDKGYKSGEDLLDFSQARIYEASENSSTDGVLKMEDIASNYNKKFTVDNIEGLVKSSIKTDYTNYDAITGGLNKSDLLILAARPAMGKTAFALNLAYNVAKKGKTVLIFSLEMSNEQLYQRMLSIASGIELGKIRSFAFNEAESLEINKGAEDLSNLNILVSESTEGTILDIKNMARNVKRKYSLDFIIIDYLQLIMSLTNDRKNREQQVSEISRSLKILAKQLDIPILALSQLSRNVEGRSDKRPMLSDLRESGAIEQDADQVMFLYRDEYYQKGNTSETESNGNLEIIELIIAKHRNGSTGALKLAVDLSRQTFKNAYNN